MSIVDDGAEQIGETIRISGQSRRKGRTRTRIHASYPGYREEKTYPGVKFRFHNAPAGAVTNHVRATKTSSGIPTDLLLGQRTSRQVRVGTSRKQ